MSIRQVVDKYRRDTTVTVPYRSNTIQAGTSCDHSPEITVRGISRTAMGDIVAVFECPRCNKHARTIVSMPRSPTDWFEPVKT